MWGAYPVVQEGVLRLLRVFRVSLVSLVSRITRALRQILLPGEPVRAGMPHHGRPPAQAAPQRVWPFAGTDPAQAGPVSGSEPVKYSGATKRASKTVSIKAQSAAVARATASICND